jgi:uncharacterized cupin superfamily protein
MSGNLLGLTAAELNQPLTDWGPRVGADVGTPQTSGLVLFSDAATGVDVGIWACTEGGWAITDRADTETVHLLAGRARLTNVDGSALELVAGDVAVLPKGWSGRWDILEPVRKFYITVG